MSRACPDVHHFLVYALEKGYEVYTSSKYPFNINIVGWRNYEGELNRFSDWIAVYWLHAGKWQWEMFQATTVPGTPMLKRPLSEKGTAILVPGQYKNAYHIGQHKGKKALQQIRPVSVYRDWTKDRIIDMNEATIEHGMFGINIHGAGVASKLVGNWSAGCQVIARKEDFNRFMDLCDRSFNAGWSNTFTYTLMEF